MAATNVKVSDAVHKEIANKLRFGGIKKEHLDELVGLVAQVYQQGLTTATVFPKGRPAWDTVVVQGVVSAANISSVLTGILTKVPSLKGVVVFPYGIVSPETFQVNVEFGGAREE